MDERQGDVLEEWKQKRRGGKKWNTHPEEKFRSNGGGKNERTNKKKKNGRAPRYKC